MAIRPAVLADWAVAQCGGYGPAWNDAVGQCRDALYAWASAEEYGFFSDLVRLVSAIPWPDGPHTHQGQQLGYLLRRVVMKELDPVEDRPLISALVVSKEENMPTGGFWGLLEGLGVAVGSSWPDRQAFWIAELKRCFEVYGQSGRPSDTGGIE
jgi:hypothetical protein